MRSRPKRRRRRAPRWSPPSPPAVMRRERSSCASTRSARSGATRISRQPRVYRSTPCCCRRSRTSNVERVRVALDLLDALGARPELSVWCMIETPLGVLAAGDIAAASPRIAALVLGTSDLANDLHARPARDRLPLLTAVGLVLLAARAYGRAVLDRVHLDLADADGFAAACRQGRDLGFDGKTLIHPDQIAPANAIFAPSAEEVARAGRLVGAYAEATASGKGAARFEGRLIEALHVDEARRTLALAAAISEREKV